MLKLTVRVGERIHVGDACVVQYEGAPVDRIILLRVWDGGRESVRRFAAFGQRSPLLGGYLNVSRGGRSSPCKRVRIGFALSDVRVRRSKHLSDAERLAAEAAAGAPHAAAG